MVLKRGLSFQGGADNPQLFQDNQQQQNQRLNFTNTNCQCKDNLWLQAYSGHLEILIRKVVREEVQQVIQHSCPSTSRLLQSETKPCESRKLKLQFEGKLPHKLFTGNKVEAEGASPIKLFLLDTVSGHQVRHGPLSSIRVKIVVLHGHFKAENWTQNEFDNNIVFEREGKRPLLVGQHKIVALHNGIACVGDIYFTDNSSWERSKMFRLGAKLEFKQDFVMEAVSSPFEVKDRRGETYQKHKIPSPDDEVWRLCWIAKDGKICKRLAEHQIYKVKDLVTQYYLDECSLRQILHVSPKKWQEIIQQATSCFSGNTSKSLSHSAKHIDTPTTIPSLQHFFIPHFYHGQQHNQISYGFEQTHHQPDQYMNPNNSLLEDLLLSNTTYNDIHLSSPSLATLDDYETSSWFPITQPSSMVEEGDNRCFMGSSYASNIGIMHSNNNNPNLSVKKDSDIAETKEGWGKVRAIWKILVEHDKATLKKGKFPHYNQQAICP